MIKYMIGLAVIAVTLSGCFHHKHKENKPIKSKERKVHPEIQKYHEAKKEKEEKKSLPEYGPTPEAVPATPVVPDLPLDDGKKKSESWWLWE